MSEGSGTKADLIAEIADLKQKIKKLEKSAAKRKQAESQSKAALKALKESEIKYRTLIDMTGTGYLILDSQGRVLDANQEYVRLSGHTKLHDILGKSVIAWTAEGAKQRNAEAVAQCAKNGFIRDFVTEYVDGGGKITPIEINASVDGEGESLRIVSLCRDITDRKRVESQREAALEAIRNSEEKYRGLTENIKLGIYRNTVGPEGKFIEANPTIIVMFGYESKEEFLATNVSDLYQNPEDRKKFNDKMLKAGVVKGEELWLKRKDGSLFVGSVSAVAVKDEQGHVTYYDGIIDNIDERKRAEQILQESEERYRALVENASDLVYKTDKKGNFTFLNRAAFFISGYEEGELVGKPFTIVIRPDMRDLAIKHFGRQFVRKIHNTYFELPIITKDGRNIWIGQNTQLIVEDDHVKGFQAVARDITERKQAESQREALLEALRESEERQKLILATLPIAIFTSPLDPGIDTSWISGDVEKITGFTIDQYMAEKDFWRNRLHADDRERVLAAYKDPAAGEEIVIEYRWLCKDGNYKWFHDRTVKKRTRQGMQYFGIILDITERKLAEEQRRTLEERLQWAEKMEAIGTLAGGIAHDFNNLLMGIQGYASLSLLHLDPSHPNYERLKRIGEQVQSGADLTRQLLGFARGGRYEVKPTNMNDIVENTSLMFGRTKKEISIHRKHGSDLWSVEVDRGQMEQVFMNLYVNAWQAMPGGGEIYLETGNVLLNGKKALPFSVQPGKYVKITVTDTGTGMDEKTRERIFDPFFTTKTMGRGTGLGLASVYGIIKGHQGMINVYSEPGHGTTFTIYLPASDKEVLKEEPAPGGIVMGGETILLVEDEKMVLAVNKEMLESMGYRVYEAGSGQEGIAVYMEKRSEIDLIILDMIMPELSGGETFDRLREINPEVKVLLSSGYSLNGEAQHIMDRGCNGFLQKPFQIEKLSRKVREMLAL